MAWSAPTVVAHVFGTGSAASRTASGTIATGQSVAIVFYGQSLGASVGGTTGDGTNTYTQRQNAGATTASLLMVDAHNVVGGTFTFTGAIGVTRTNWGFFVLAATPDAGSIGAYDTGANGTVGSTQTPSSGASGTVSGGNELAIEGACWVQGSAAGSISGANSYTLPASGSDVTVIGAEGAVAYRLLTPASGTVTGNGAANSGGGAITSSVAALVVWKESGGADPFPAGYPIPQPTVTTF